MNTTLWNFWLVTRPLYRTELEIQFPNVHTNINIQCQTSLQNWVYQDCLLQRLDMKSSQEIWKCEEYFSFSRTLRPHVSVGPLRINNASRKSSPRDTLRQEDRWKEGGKARVLGLYDSIRSYSDLVKANNCLTKPRETLSCSQKQNIFNPTPDSSKGIKKYNAWHRTNLSQKLNLYMQYIFNLNQDLN